MRPRSPSPSWGCAPSPRRARAVGALAALLALAGCAHGEAARPDVVRAPPLRVAVEPVGPDALETYDAEALFLRGLDLLDGEAWAEAADYFERLLREFPDDERAVLAHYNRGVAYIHLERGEEAVAAFDAYLAGLPPTAHPKDVLDGRFKRGQALAVAKRYEEVVALFDEMLGEELSPDDRIEALVDSGVGHYMLGLRPGGDQTHRPTAEYRFLEARRIVKKESQTRRMDHMQFFMGQSAFYLAQLAHLEFTEQKLTWPSSTDIEREQAEDPDATLESLLGAQLEEKCQRLLRAQYQYLRAIREGHAGWASAAGYNVAHMYEELHAEMMGLPPPSDLTPEQQRLYTQLVRKKVLILLEKAEKTYAQTTEMVVRTGAHGVWGDKAKLALENVRKRILEESAALVGVDDEEPVVPVADASRGSKGRS